jgi:hypothetical protein
MTQEVLTMNNESNTTNAQEAQTAGAVALKLLGPVQGNEAAGITKAPSTSQEMRVIEVSEALVPAYQKASMLELTDEEVAKLTAPFPDEVVEIRPNDGLIYIPHIHISDRFNKVFKPGSWALMRRREWFDDTDQVMYGEYVLTIRGCFVGESVGGHPYPKTNKKLNYSDVLESTAAEALRRIGGKRLSCGSQVWNPEYARQWVAKYAQLGPERDYKGNLQWKKKPLAASVLHPTTAPPIKAAPASNVAQGRPLAERIAGLKFKLGGLVGWAEGYLRSYTVEGSDANAALMPNESIEDLNEQQVEWLAKNWASFMQRLEQHVEDNPSNEAGDTSEDYRPSSSPVEEERLLDEGDDEWFMDIIVPVPRKGMKRDIYLKHPDTIRSLHDARHDDDEARRRLWGFLNNYTPEPWKKRDGTMVQPSDGDVKFREALDAYGDWFEKNHPDEKL